MKITRDDLTRRGACSEGLIWFDAAFPDGIEGEWSRDAQLMALAFGAGPWLGWAVSVGILPLWSMQGVDLRGVDLRGAYLEGAYLEGAIGLSL